MKKSIKKNIDENKLKLDDLKMYDIILNLDRLEKFTDEDIKKALKKTGRSININGQFFRICQNFIQALGDTVKKDRINGKYEYTIISKDKALEKAGYKKAIRGAALGIPSSVDKFHELSKLGPLPEVEEAPKQEQEFSISWAEEKIGSIIGVGRGRKPNSVVNTIKLVAIFLRHGKKEMPWESVEKEWLKIGVISSRAIKYQGKDTCSEILEALGYYRIEVGKDDVWKLVSIGSVELLDVYMRLVEVYEKSFNRTFEGLDDYISNGQEEEKPAVVKKVEKKPEAHFVVEAEESKPEFRKDSKEVMWKKWLLLSALRNFMGSTKIITLVEWIKNTRYEEIPMDEARKLLVELYQDSGEIKIGNGDFVTLKDYKVLLGYYNPKEMKETIYVKLKLSPKEMEDNFEGLQFSVDSELVGGEYIYEIVVDRSFQSEYNLKKLISQIKISGKMYSYESSIVNRVTHILDQEERREKLKRNDLIRLESF